MTYSKSEIDVAKYMHSNLLRAKYFMDHLNAVGTYYLQWTQVWETVETLI